MKRLDALFHIYQGNSLELVSLTKCSIFDNEKVSFVSRTRENNGVSAFVKKVEGIEPFREGLITVAGSGNSVLESFIQPTPFYTGFHVFVLEPKIQLSFNEKLFYCYCIRQNQYLYSYGRQANRTLKNLMLPSYENIPSWVNNNNIESLNSLQNKTENEINLLNTSSWKWFRYDEIFNIKKGFYNKKPIPSTNDGEIPFIGATDSNNGITGYYNLEDITNSSKTGDNNNAPIEEKIFDKNCITVSNNGSIGYAFYQSKTFTCSHDVNPLYLKDYEMNKEIALFLCTLIELEQYRWAFGRKWRPSRMPDSLIKLPITGKGKPDWNYMENYIKSLPYSENL